MSFDPVAAWSKLSWKLGRPRALRRFLLRLAARFTTLPADDFSRFMAAEPKLPQRRLRRSAPPELTPERPPEPANLAPANVELRFTALQIEGRFEEMWAMLAEDAQRSWGSRDAFVREMQVQSREAQVLEAEVRSVQIVPEWLDSRRRRRYRNVARLAMRYRIKHQEEELEMSRDVHLVPAADGWRTLAYGPQTPASR